jgi:SAM-dependent methyltransferase
MNSRCVLRLMEQQVRLFPLAIRGKSMPGVFREALRLPLVTLREYRAMVEHAPVVVQDEFDHRYGTETSGRHYTCDLGVSHPNWIHSLAYFPTPSRLLPELLAGLDLRFRDVTFVDLGSGKGRVLLMASQFPFRRVIGVEFAPELHEAAVRNLNLYSGPRLCSKIELACEDFTEFPFPDEPLFVFLYNPASRALSEVLARNLLQSIREHPREVWVLYVAPLEVFDRAEELKLVKSGECCGHPYRLYRSEWRKSA